MTGSFPIISVSTLQPPRISLFIAPSSLHFSYLFFPSFCLSPPVYLPIQQLSVFLSLSVSPFLSVYLFLSLCLSLFVSSFAAAISFGSNEFGQLGQGAGLIQIAVCRPRAMLLHPEVISSFSSSSGLSQILFSTGSCGENFSVVLSSTGMVFACGDHSQGCLGLGGGGAAGQPSISRLFFTTKRRLQLLQLQLLQQRQELPRQGERTREKGEIQLGRRTRPAAPAAAAVRLTDTLLHLSIPLLLLFHLFLR